MNSPRITNLSPLLGRLKTYRRETLVSDLIAGLVVAIMLVPQAMAYAMLAGLPPQTGLYASIVPLILYSLFGTSNALAVGPVAMVSLLVVSGVGELAVPGSPEFIRLCLTLALMIGVLQIAMAVLRLGFLVNFISHPVLVGFTSAAAIVIGFGQIKHLFGVSVKDSSYPIVQIANTFVGLEHFNPVTLAIGLGSCAILVFFCFRLASALQVWGIPKNPAETLAKLGPLAAVLIAALVTWWGNLAETSAVAIVGLIPAGLPQLTIPDLSLHSLRALFPLALVITVVGYLESISVAKALAGMRQEKVDANRELFALGLADVGAAFTGGFPVTGGFSRSLVNFSSGVKSPVGSIVTALLVAFSLVFLTPFFFYIPNAVLAAIIVVAVVRLIDFRAPFKLWRVCRADAIALMITFAAVLGLGIETGILFGIGSTIVLLMWRMSRPHVAVVGRVGETEHFRNVLRHPVEQTAGVLAFRVDESLNFANAPFLENYVVEQVAERPDVHSVLLISSGINDIDSTGIDVLGTIIRHLDSRGVKFYLSDVKGPVSDRLKRAGFERSFFEEHVFLSAHEAIRQLAKPASLLQ